MHSQLPSLRKQWKSLKSLKRTLKKNVTSIMEWMITQMINMRCLLSFKKTLCVLYKTSPNPDTLGSTHSNTLRLYYFAQLS